MNLTTTARKTLSRITALGIGLSSFLFFQPTVSANECEDNPTTLSDDCYETPDRYEIIIYELGLCTSDPLSGTNFDDTSCTSTYSNDNGLVLNIAPGSTQGLTGGTSSKPGAGSYAHAYIKMKNTFGLNGTYKINGTTFYSDSSGNASSSASSASDWTETLNDFSAGENCDEEDYTASETFTTGVTGTIKARLANDSYTTVTSCPAATRLVGSFAPTNPIIITENQRGLEVDFTVTKSGMTVIRQSNTVVNSFSSGPFRARFTSY